MGRKDKPQTIAFCLGSLLLINYVRRISYMLEFKKAAFFLMTLIVILVTGIFISLVKDKKKSKGAKDKIYLLFSFVELAILVAFMYLVQ